MFTPDQAFVQLVQRNIRRLRVPATRRVELVHAELLKLVDAAGDFHALAVFPSLRASLTTLVAAKLRESLEAADVTLKTLVDMELSRINIAHPEFVGRHGVGLLLAAKERDLRRAEANKPPPSPMAMACVKINH